MVNALRFVFLMSGFCFLICSADPLDAQPGDGDAVTKGGADRDPGGWYVHGNLDLRYIYRANDDDNDSDLYQYLSLSFGQTKNGMISGYVSARLSQDLDGRERTTDAFSSIADTHDRFYARLNAAYMDVRLARIVDTVRVGRQWLDEVPEVVRVDGVHLETVPLDDFLRTRLVLYGGIPEHFEESSQRGDRVFGGGVSFRPLDETRIGAFYSRIRDEYKARYWGGAGTTVFDDDLVSFELNQRFFEGAVALDGLYTNLNGDSRESRVRLAYNGGDGKTSVNLHYRTLFSTQSVLSTELDPFVSVLRDYQPYHEVGMDVRREFTEHLGVDGGVQVRRLEEENDEGPFNHDFERYYLSGLVMKWPFELSNITVTGDLYDANGDRFWVGEGSWEHEIARGLKVKGGTSYALYHENRFTFEENTHVRTGYLDLRYELVKNLTISAGYDIERDDIDTTHTIETRIRFRF